VGIDMRESALRPWLLRNREPDWTDRVHAVLLSSPRLG